MKRPPGVTMLALLILLYGLLVLGLSILGLILSVLHSGGNLPQVPIIVWRWSVIDLVAITAQFALGVFALVGGIGMLCLRPWSWLLGMLLLGCELVIQLDNYFQGHPAYLMLFITALLVLFLNRRPMREAFNMEPLTAAPQASMPVESAVSEEGASVTWPALDVKEPER